MSPLRMAEAFIQAGELDDALEALAAHLQTNADDNTALRMRAAINARRPGHEQDVLQDLALLEAPTATDHYRRSVMYERLGDFSAALAASREAQAIATDDRERSRAIARELDLLRKDGQLQAALDLALSKDWVQWAADAAADLHDHATAVTYYTQALARVAQLNAEQKLIDNIRARVLLKRAGAYLRLGQLDEADADYLTAEVLLPTEETISFNRGLIAARRGQMQNALALCRHAWGRANAATRKRMAADLQDYPQLAADLL